MEMIRWLLNNRLLQTVWGLGILAVLLAWIFGGNNAEPEVAVTEPVKVEQVAGVETTDTSVKAVETEATTEVAAEKASTEATAETEVVAEVKADAEPSTEVQAAVGAEAATAVVVATQVETETTEEKVAEPVAKEAGTESVESTSEVVAQTEAADAIESKDVANSSEEVVIEAKAEVVAENTDSEPAVETEVEIAAVVASDSLVSKSSEDLLMMAREAYWNNGLDEATDLYTALIEREPNVIEHKGELGNVFWRQGYPKKAAELYADIAAPMIEKGNGERVSNMVGFIGLFFPDRASEIRKLLEAQ